MAVRFVTLDGISREAKALGRKLPENILQVQCQHEDKKM